MNKKGFTLTELLLVILLVAILSLLGSTAAVNQLNKQRKNTAYRNAIGYVNAINDYNFVNEGESPITSGSTSTISSILKDSFEGKKPTSGTVTIDSTTHKVTSATLVFGNYTITYNGTNYTISNN